MFFKVWASIKTNIANLRQCQEANLCWTCAGHVWNAHYSCLPGSRSAKPSVWVAKSCLCRTVSQCSRRYPTLSLTSQAVYVRIAVLHKINCLHEFCLCDGRLIIHFNVVLIWDFLLFGTHTVNTECTWSTTVDIAIIIIKISPVVSFYSIVQKFGCV